MKNYYFNRCLDVLEENTIYDCGDIYYIVVNNVEKFKAFCDKINMIDDGVTSTGVYYFNYEYEEWVKSKPCINTPIYSILTKYLNKKEDNTKNNNVTDKKENTLNYVIEFKKGGSMSKNNCPKSFHLLSELSDSIIYNKNVKKVIIEVN